MTEETEKSPVKSNPFTGRIAEWTAVVILVLLPLIVYLPVTSGYATFAGFDHTGINQPLKQDAFQSMRSGDLPLWEHRLDRGLPLFAEGEAGVFYPLNIFFLIPGDFLAIYNFVILLCLSTAGLLFYWWVRRFGVGPLAGFIGAAAHQWGATVNFNKANLNILEGFILAPLLMLLLEPPSKPDKSSDRPWRRGAWIALVFAAMVFAGQAQYVAYTGLFAFVYIIVRTISSGKEKWKSTLHSMGTPFAIGATLGAGLAAVQLFSTLELIPLSERGVHAIDEGFSIRGLWLSPGRLFATYIFPAYHYSLEHFLPYLSTTVYVGPVAILLAGYAIRFRNHAPSRAFRAMIPLLIAGLIFLYLAMGANAPLAGKLTSFGPLAHFRGHGRLGGYFAMVMIVLMAMGLDIFLKTSFMQEKKLLDRKRYIPIFTVEVFLMGLLAIPFITGRAEYLETRYALVLMLGIIIIFFAGTLIGRLMRSRVPISIAVMLTLAIQIIGFQATSSETILMRSSWDSDLQDISHIEANTESDDKATMIAIRTQASVRIHERFIERGLAGLEGGSHAHIDHLGSANAGLMKDLSICNADLPLELARWEWLMHRNLWPKLDFTVGELDTRHTNLLYALGINWIVTENADLEIDGWTRESEPGWVNGDIPFYIYRRERGVQAGETRYYFIPPHAIYWNWTDAPGNASEDAARDAFMDLLDSSPFMMEPFIEGLEDQQDESGAMDTGVSRRGSVIQSEWRSRTEYFAVVNVSDDAIFMLRDAWYPGWEVTVNGKPAELLRANLVFKAVKIKGGRNEIVFRYKPTYLGIGWTVSLISLLIIIGLMIKIRRSKPNIPDEIDPKEKIQPVV